MTFENACHECLVIVELVAQKLDSPLPECPCCGKAMERMISAPAVIWTKPMADYGSKNSEGYHRQQKDGGHWTMETDKDTGKVHRTFIGSHADQKSYCRRNGLMNPSDLPSNLSIAKDGRSYETVNKCEI